MEPGLFSCRSHPNLHAVSYVQCQYGTAALQMACWIMCQSRNRVGGFTYMWDRLILGNMQYGTGFESSLFIDCSSYGDC